MRINLEVRVNTGRRTQRIDGRPLQKLDVIVSRRTERVKREIGRAEQESLKDLDTTAAAQTSGSYSLKQLAKMGHPYAKRHPQPGLPPEILNIQGGSLVEDWRTEEGTWRTSGKTGVLKSSLSNQNPAWQWLKGTTVMVRRSVRQAILGQVLPRRRQRLRQAIRKGTRR